MYTVIEHVYGFTSVRSCLEPTAIAAITRSIPVVKVSYLQKNLPLLPLPHTHPSLLIWKRLSYQESVEDLEKSIKIQARAINS